MSKATEIKRARLWAERALLRRLNQGYHFTSSDLPTESYYRNDETRARMGADPMRPVNTHAEALAAVEAELAKAKPSALLAELVAQFGLDPIETNVLELCCASKLDRDTALMCRAMSKTRSPTASLVAEILEVTQFEVMATVRPGSRLRAFGLVEVEEVSALSEVQASSRVVDWILGVRGIEPALRGVCSFTDDSLSAVTLAASVSKQAQEWGKWLVNSHEPAAVVFHGPLGSGIEAAAVIMVAALGQKLMLINSDTLVTESGPTNLLGKVLTECGLHRAIPFFDRLDKLDAKSPHYKSLFESIESFPGVVMFGSSGSGRPSVPLSRPTRLFTIGRSTLPDRVNAWKESLEPIKKESEVPKDYAKTLGARYVVGPAIISAVTDEAYRYARSEHRKVLPADIEEAVGRRLTLRLGAFGDLISRQASLEEMVLQEEVKSSILDMIAMVEQRSKILEEWGYARHLSLSRGVSALFSGKPGTGKTMAASVISSELGLDLVRIDLSSVMSKWVGETEKHLAQIFDEAQSANAMLLFDEADSLFGKRTEVKSSSDRYANLEVNYILQRIESFDGICVLTTNFETSIDQAFLRRIMFKVRFPEPELEERIMLWKQLIPKETGMTGEVDFERLAYRFEMAGGHIRNAIVKAAIIAARDNRTIMPRDLLVGAHQEYEEMGKVMSSMEY